MLLKKKYLLFLGLILIFLVVFGIITLNSDKSGKVRSEIKSDNNFKEGIYEGEISPDFTLEDLNRGKISLKSFRGKIVLLNFWATWCPPCRKEIPSIAELYKKYKEKGLEVIGVNLDRMNRSGVGKLSSEYNINFPVLLDPAGKVADLYGIVALPTTFILDRKGRIRERVTGGLNWITEENIKKFETLLAESQ